MNRRSLILSLLCGLTLALCGLGRTPARADTDSDTTTTFSDMFFNQCASESVPITGTMHTVAHTTIDATGGLHVQGHVNMQGTGTAAISGNQYVLNDSSNFTLNNSTAGASENTTEFHTNLIAQGSVPNLKITFLMHITVNANGEVTVFIDTFNAECKG